MIYIDTHIAVWLYAGLVDNLSVNAHFVLDNEDLLVLPKFAELELQTWYEQNKITVKTHTLLQSLNASIGLNVSQIPLENALTYSLNLTWATDVFDRLIVAEAESQNCGLVTQDPQILAHCKNAIW